MAKKKSTVNKAGNYTKPGMRKRMFKNKMAGSHGTAWTMECKEKHRC